MAPSSESSRAPLLLLKLLDVDVICANLCQLMIFDDLKALSSLSRQLITSSLTRAQFLSRACFIVPTWRSDADMALFLSRIRSDMVPLIKHVRFDPTICFDPQAPSNSDLRETAHGGGDDARWIHLFSLSTHSMWAIFQQVEVLDLAHDVTANTKAIGRLAKLTHLNLTMHIAPDLAPIAQLTTLRHLILNESNVTDVSLAHVKSFPILETLEIRNCRFVTDLSCLVALKNLRRLVIGGNEVRYDFSVLSELTKLRHFQYVSATRKSWPKMDFPLHAPDLEFCDVAQTPVRNADFLLFSPRLRYLDISWTTLSSTPPLGHLTQLRVLVVSSPLPRDLEYYAPLETLSELECIEFHKIGQASLEPPVIEAKFPERVRRLLTYP